MGDTVGREELILALTGIGDMERLIGRMVYGTGGGRDLAALRAAAEKLPAVKAQLARLLPPAVWRSCGRAWTSCRTWRS